MTHQNTSLKSPESQSRVEVCTILVHGTDISDNSSYKFFVRTHRLYWDCKKRNTQIASANPLEYVKCLSQRHAHTTSKAPKAANITTDTRCTGTWNTSDPAADDVVAGAADPPEVAPEAAADVNDVTCDDTELSKLEPSEAREEVMLAAVDVAPESTELALEEMEDASELRPEVGGSTPEMSDEADEMIELSESVAVLVSCLSTRAGSGAASATTSSQK